MIQQIDLTQFAVGFAAGLVVLSALFYVRPLAQAALCASALGVGYLLYVEGVPGLVAYGANGVEYLQRHQTFIQGVAVGKFAAGLVKWRTGRPQRAWRQ